MLYRKELYRQVAALHAVNINQGFLSTLGVRFLALMYEAIDEADDSVLMVSQSDDRVFGFVSGSIGMGPIYRRMLRHPVSLLLSLLPSLFRTRRVKHIWEILKHGTNKQAQGDWPAAELLSIAVAADARGSGVAEALYGRLVDHFKSSGISAFKIVVGDGLQPAHRFYKKMGAVRVGRLEVHSGKESIVYVHDVQSLERA